MSLRALSVVAATLPALAGCGDGAPASSAATTAAAPAPAPPGPLVALERGGGLTGAVVGVEVSRAGRVVPRPSGRRLRLRAAELAALRREVRAARLGPSTARPPVVPDAFVYELTAGAGRVVWSTQPPPARVRPLARHLQELLRRARAA